MPRVFGRQGYEKGICSLPGNALGKQALSLHLYATLLFVIWLLAVFHLRKRVVCAVDQVINNPSAESRTDNTVIYYRDCLRKPQYEIASQDRVNSCHHLNTHYGGVKKNV